MTGRVIDLYAGPYVCKDCGIPYAQPDMFWINKTSPTGQCRNCRSELRKTYYAQNRSGAKEYALAWKRRNPHKITEYGRRRRHGLEPEAFEAMLREQQGACAICRRSDEPLKVDHCHDSLMIRGLLCDRCNRGLGFFADQPQRLRSAAEYLERNGR